MAAYWSALPAGAVTVLDVNGNAGAARSRQLQAALPGERGGAARLLQTAAGGGLSLAAAERHVIEGYHVDVAPFCAAAARAFFSQF